MRTQAEVEDKIATLNARRAEEQERYLNAIDFPTSVNAWHAMMRYESQTAILRWVADLPKPANRKREQ